MTVPIDWSTAACATLPLLEGVRIFCGESDGGLAVRTSAHPKADNHEEARRLCPACPLVEPCLTAALREDNATFRGLSPEERAAFGGARSHRNRTRQVYLTVAQVLARASDSGYDLVLLLTVLARHEQWLTRQRQSGEVVADQPQLPAGWGEAWLSGDEPFDQVWARLIAA